MNFQQAEALLQAKGKSFAFAKQLLSREAARRATWLYAICRSIDDLVDERLVSVAVTRKQLQALQAETLQSEFFHSAQINAAALQELILGVGRDLDPLLLETESELLKYCYQVAGTVGIMMCDVLEVEQKGQAAQHAGDLGMAMQLTNICRDVKEDAALGRRYLPAALLQDLPGQVQASDFSLAVLQAPFQLQASQQVVLKKTLSHLLALAERYYDSGQRGLIYLPRRARLGVWVALSLYREIGVQLQARDYDYWSKRVSLSGWQKTRLTARAVLRFVCTPRWWWRR